MSWPLSMMVPSEMHLETEEEVHSFFFCFEQSTRSHLWASSKMSPRPSTFTTRQMICEMPGKYFPCEK